MLVSKQLTLTQTVVLGSRHLLLVKTKALSMAAGLCLQTVLTSLSAMVVSHLWGQQEALYVFDRASTCHFAV